MKTFCLASSAWIGSAPAAKALMARILDQAAQDASSIILDRQTVMREPAQGASPPSVHEIDLREWVSETLREGGVLNIEAVRRQANNFDRDAIVVLRAVGFLPDMIVNVLSHLRVGLYSAPAWPGALAVVCDDTQIYQVGPALANAFYVRPAVVVGLALEHQVRGLARRANLLRRFGGRVNRLMQRIEERRFERRLTRLTGRGATTET